MSQEYSLLFDSVVDKSGDITSLFQVTRIPAAIVYYKGKIIHYSDKEFDFMQDDFIELLEKKLK